MTGSYRTSTALLAISLGLSQSVGEPKPRILQVVVGLTVIAILVADVLRS